MEERGKEDTIWTIRSEHVDLNQRDSILENISTRDEICSPVDEGSVKEGFLSCGRFSLLWLLATTMVQLGIYLNKLYQDSAAVRQYFAEKDINFCAVSAFCLFLPATIYIIYVVAVHIKKNPHATMEEVGTQIVHGLLLIPWQIKGRVELLHFASQRACYLKPLSKEEKQEKSRMEMRVAVLTFFETFYAGLTQILLQFYIIISSLQRKSGYSAITAEIVASALCLLSMIVSVRRRDDYILTGTLSVAGWICIIISRSVAISLATTVIHSWMVLICLAHGVGMSVWIFHMALDTYPSETALQFTTRKKVALFFVIFGVLGLPSLVYWPIMFHLRKQGRPIIFLFVLFIENLAFVCFWALLTENKVWSSHDCTFVTVIGSTFLAGVAFVSCYMKVKPKPTDDIVYYDMKTGEETTETGMFFEFCDTVFHIQRNEDMENKLRILRKERRASKK